MIFFLYISVSFHQKLNKFKLWKSKILSLKFYNILTRVFNVILLDIDIIKDRKFRSNYLQGPRWFRLLCWLFCCSVTVMFFPALYYLFEKLHWRLADDINRILTNPYIYDATVHKDVSAICFEALYSITHTYTIWYCRFVPPFII